MNSEQVFVRLLAKDRALTIAGLVVLWALAWVYTATGAQTGMSPSEMTTLALFPHEQAADMANMAGDGMTIGVRPIAASAVTVFLLLTLMWWVMMVAMMSPSAAPTILLYARVYRHSHDKGRADDKLAPTVVFAAGYLLVWLAFSIMAAGLQWMIQPSGIISDMGSRSRWLSAFILMAAGLYQFTPLKSVCLTHCRSPAEFLSRHWRANSSGALRLGALHGAYCVGCCWVLMALLFVGGVMNLVWIAMLSALVLVEKLLPPGRWVGQAAGLVLIGWSIATVLV